jgi:hypothetical protein
MLVLVVSLELLVEQRSLVVAHLELDLVGLVLVEVDQELLLFEVVAHLELDLVELVLVEVDQQLLLEVVALSGQVVVEYCMELG